MHTMDVAPQWIVLAQLLRPQGRRGEILADLFTDFPERFTQHPQVWLAPAGFADRVEYPAAPADPKVPPTPQAAEVVAHWLPIGKNAGRIVLHFAGIDTIEQAEQLAGSEVLVPIAERVPLEPGSTYISDLVGCTLYDRGRALGVVASVEFPTTPDGMRRLEDAAPLLAVTSPEGDEILIPYANAFLRSLDTSTRSIHMDLPEGLAEINQPNQPNRPTQQQ
jgi:16S rRNA processing protein RimM